MATRSKIKWTKDSQGQYPRQIGWKRNEKGQYVQHKFRLGDDLKEAQKREQRLQEFWQQIETNYAGEGRPSWNGFTLSIAKQIAKGTVQIVIPRMSKTTPESYARWLHRLQRHYPMISIVGEDEEAYVTGAVANKSRTLAEIEKIQAVAFNVGNIGEYDLTPTANGTLHEAMRAYISWIEKDYHRPELGRISGNGRTKIRQTETLMGRHPDIPLSKLDEATIEDMIRFWRQRPIKKGSDKAITKKSAENYIGELKRFLKWLHKSLSSIGENHKTLMKLKLAWTQRHMSNRRNLSRWTPTHWMS